MTLTQPQSRRRDSGLDGHCVGSRGKCRKPIFKAGMCERHYHDHRRNLVDNISAGGAKTPQQIEREKKKEREERAKEVRINYLMATAKREENDRRRRREKREQVRPQ